MSKLKKKKVVKSRLRSLTDLDMLAMGGPTDPPPTTPTGVEPPNGSPVNPVAVDTPTKAELDRWKFLDFDKGSNKITWENNKLLTSKDELNAFLYEHPESRSAVAAGRRVWSGPNKGYVMNAEDDAEFAKRFSPGGAPAAAAVAAAPQTPKAPTTTKAVGNYYTEIGGTGSAGAGEGQNWDIDAYYQSIQPDPTRAAAAAKVDAERAASRTATEGMTVPEKKEWAHQQYLDMKASNNSELALGGELLAFGGGVADGSSGTDDDDDDSPFRAPTDGEAAIAQAGLAVSGPLSDAIKGDVDNRDNQVSRGVGAGAVKYGAKGAALGMQVGGPWGALIGGVAGTIGGGVAGGVEADKVKQQYYDDHMAANFADGGIIGNDPNQGVQGNPTEVTEYNGLPHEQGGLPIGDKEVEDGEIRVGNYVFSDRLTGVDGKTFATKAKSIAKRFEEHKNDGAALRTQKKQMDNLKFENDEARKNKEAEDASATQSMESDYLALGGMMHVDDAGKSVVLPENKKEFMSAARNAKMGYGAYKEKFFKHSKDRLAFGGGLGDSQDPFESDIESADQAAVPGQFAETYLTEQEASTNKKLQAAEDYLSMQKFLGYDNNTFAEFEDDVAKGSGAKGSGAKGSGAKGGEGTDGSPFKFGKEEAGLIASAIPAISNSIRGGSKQLTTFDRIELEGVDLEEQRTGIKRAVKAAGRRNKANIAGTAKDSGSALSALSASSAGLTDIETAKLGESYAAEETANKQIANQQALANNQISREEYIARQQDDAVQNSYTDAGTAALSANTQGYLKDKGLASANEEYNEQVVALLNTGEYKMIKDPETGQFKPVHIATYDAAQSSKKD